MAKNVNVAFSVENGEVKHVPRLRRRSFCTMTWPIFNGNVYRKIIPVNYLQYCKIPVLDAVTEKITYAIVIT